MPLVEELPTTIQSAYFSADYIAVRSRGAHLKVIIDDFLEYHHLSAKRKNADFADSLEEFASLGFAWERAVTRYLSSNVAVAWPDGDAPPELVRKVYEHAVAAALNEAERERTPSIIKLGETECDGIYCTQDGFNKRIRTPEEWKCSWGSAARGIREDWMMQMMGYAYAWGFDGYVLRAYYVNGYYEKGQMGKPVARSWRLRFSDAELEENWSLVCGHRDLMIEEGRI